MLKILFSIIQEFYKTTGHPLEEVNQKGNYFVLIYLVCLWQA